MDVKTMNDLHEAFFQTGATRDVTFRVDALKKLEKTIKRHEVDILDALKKDLNKSHFEGYETELGIVYGELRDAIKNTNKWSKPHKVKTPFLHLISRSYVYPEPFGNTLIMSPWNYPFQLTIVPLIGAISAGNCCVVKPSEYSYNTATIIEKIIKETFDENFVSVVRGGREANKSLLAERFDYVFFTGSPSVGKFVMESASKYLTPVTLELGGKSPCIVDQTANVDLAAKRIAWGKFLNGGQTCIAPDYLLVHTSVKDALIDKIKGYILDFYGENPQNCEYYPKMINQKHYDRLSALLQDGNLLFGGRKNDTTLQIEPTIIDGVTFESPIMQEEIFGPILPVLTFEKISDAFSVVSSRPKPLACYLFSTDRSAIEYYTKNLSFGGGCINETIMQIANANLPFGGVGNSGMGKYHSKLSFDTFTNFKAVIKKSNLVDVPLRYPPFNDKLKYLKKIEK